MRMVTEILWGVTEHPDTPLRGREPRRHMLRTDAHMKSLCGKDIAWVYDYATPLLQTCMVCQSNVRHSNPPIRMRRVDVT